METSIISSALRAANVDFDRVRKHGDTGFRVTKLTDIVAAKAALAGLEGVAVDSENENSITLELSHVEQTAKQPESTVEQTERTKNPAYDVVFDMALKALESGDTLTEWKAGRKVRMMQTIRSQYPDAFEKQGRNVVFTGKVGDISKKKVLANLGLKTERSLPKTEAAA